jgi:hypothetical protein
VRADVKDEEGLQLHVQAGKARKIRVQIKPKPGETDAKFFVNADNNIGDQDAVGVS